MTSAQPLPSFSLTLHSHKTILPNLSYPSRPNAHIPWSGSSAPLLFTKTTRPEVPIAAVAPNAPTGVDIGFDTCAVPGAFHGINLLFWHNLSIIVRKLKLIRQKLFGTWATSPSIAANV